MSWSYRNDRTAAPESADGAGRESSLSGRDATGIVFAALVQASMDVAGPIRADRKVVEQFLCHCLTGCVRQSGAWGHTRLRSPA